MKCTVQSSPKFDTPNACLPQCHAVVDVYRSHHPNASSLPLIAAFFTYTIAVEVQSAQVFIATFTLYNLTANSATLRTFSQILCKVLLTVRSWGMTITAHMIKTETASLKWLSSAAHFLQYRLTQTGSLQNTMLLPHSQVIGSSSAVLTLVFALVLLLSGLLPAHEHHCHQWHIPMPKIRNAAKRPAGVRSD